MVFLRTRTAKKELTTFGDRIRGCQEAFATLLTSLIHRKLDTTDSRTCIVKPEDNPRLPSPLFRTDPAAPEQSVLLNQVLWLLFNDCLSWPWAEHVVLVLRHSGGGQAFCGILRAIAASKFGHTLLAAPKISKNLVAYTGMVGLVAVT
jgi:hypothetical protein